MSNKISISSTTNPLVMPVVIMSTESAEGVVNFSSVGWITKVNPTPPLIAFSMGPHKKTVKNILETGKFGINIPDNTQIDGVERCGMNSGNMVKKADWFTVRKGEKTGAPLVEECPINLECIMWKTFDLPKDILIIAQIENILCRTDIIENGKIDLYRCNPVIHSMMGDYIYIAPGKKTDDAYKKR